MEEDHNTLRATQNSAEYMNQVSGIRPKKQCGTREILSGYGLWDLTDTREQGFAKFGKPESSIC